MARPATENPSHTAIGEAAEWFVRLREPDASEDTQAAWERWLDTSTDNRMAWGRVQRVQQHFAATPAHIAMPTLTTAGKQRRRLFQLTVGGAIALPVGWMATRPEAWSAWTADLSTTTGEIRPVTLADGSQVVLDTDTALDLAFDSQWRRLVLHRGTLYVRTATDARRPLVVDTRHGAVQALGTEFTVQVDDDGAWVQVREHAVRITPRLAPDRVRQIEAGQSTRFSSHGTGTPNALGDDDFANWRHGSLLADRMPMAQVVNTLAAYYRGRLSLDPTLAAIPVSGVFPLAKTELALAALENAHPVEIQRFTPYWTRITPANASN